MNGFDSGLCHFIAEFPRTSYLTSVCLSFLIFKMANNSTCHLGYSKD